MAIQADGQTDEQTDRQKYRQTKDIICLPRRTDRQTDEETGITLFLHSPFQTLRVELLRFLRGLPRRLSPSHHLRGHRARQGFRISGRLHPRLGFRGASSGFADQPPHQRSRDDSQSPSHHSGCLGKKV